MLCDEEDLVTSPHLNTKPSKLDEEPAVLLVQSNEEPLAEHVPNYASPIDSASPVTAEDGTGEEVESSEYSNGDPTTEACNFEVNLTPEESSPEDSAVEVAVALNSLTPEPDTKVIVPESLPEEDATMDRVEHATTESTATENTTVEAAAGDLVAEDPTVQPSLEPVSGEEVGEEPLAYDEESTDSEELVERLEEELNERLAVAEIEQAAAVEDSSSSSSVGRSFGSKIAALSKSVTPPNWGPAREEARVVFSSLNNLASRLIEPRPVTSASTSDLDRYSVQPSLSERMRNGREDTLSSISDELSELGAYETVKQESAALDALDAPSPGSVERADSPANTTAEELRKVIKKLEYELDVANGTIKHVYDESTRRLGEVGRQHDARVEQINRQFVECIKERDVAREGLAESTEARRRLQANKENLIKNLASQADENEKLRKKLQISTEDCVKLKKELDARVAECGEQRKQLKKLGDDLSSAAIKVQWANSKLQSECDAHRSTRTKLSGMDAKIREAKEEANMIRNNCQAMIDKYQHSEEIQSNALGNKLEKLELEHKSLQTRFSELTETHERKCMETEQITRQMEQIRDQLFDKDAQYQRTLAESRTRESDKLALANQLEDLDERLNSYNELKTELKSAYLSNQQLDGELGLLREKLSLVEKCNVELTEKERENLEYFQRVGERDAQLQLQLNQTRVERDRFEGELASLTTAHKQLTSDYESLSALSKSEAEKASLVIDTLECKVAELEEGKGALECQLGDLRNEAVVSRRKHQADSKDLLRQIDQFRRQLERQEESMRRAESVNSLESGGGRGEAPQGGRTRSGASSEADEGSSESSSHALSMDQARAMLIERLCSLQRVLAKRQEKIEFYESHVDTLTKDLQKKTRVIQSLLLRVETGERTRLAGEAYKSPLERAGAGNGMTLKLSVEINEKLQQVLEDTLFKNITLKENIKTLGEEIERLHKQ